MRLVTNVSLATLATLVLLSACAAPDAPTAFIMPTEPLAARPAPSTPLAMTIRDAADLGAMHIRSDGLGDYVHGQQGMQVEIDQYGNMQIGPTTTPPQRTINIDYGNPVDPNNTYRPDPAGQVNFKFVSNKSATGAPSIHDLGVNGAPSAACYALTVAHQNASTHHRDVFNTASAAEATFAYVTRISLAPSQWTVESGSPLCGTNPHVAALYSQDLTRKNAPLVFRGYYYQRLSLVLRGL